MMANEAGYISPNGASVLSQSLENPVAVVSPRQQWLEAQRQLPRDLMGGTDVMRAAGRRYLPQHEAESSESYTVRLMSTVLYGAFSQTVVRQAGKLFMKPVALLDADQTIVDFSLDVDGQGRSITAFSNDLVKEAFVDGIAMLFVDYPKIINGATQADVIIMGARPYWVLISARQILGWKSISAGGRQILLQIRIREEVEQSIDEFNVEIVEQIRVLELGGLFRTYRKVLDKKGKEDWVLVEAGRASWIEIPIIPVYTNRCGFFEGLPPLRELAELNQEHWVSSSEQRRALSFGRFGMLKIIGKPPAAKNAKKDVVIAPDAVIEVGIGGDVGMVESSGAGIAAGLSDLSAIEQRMRTTGMQVSVENAGEVTATAVATDSAEGNAALKAIAKGIETALNDALLLTGQLLRIANVGIARLSDEFAEPVQGDANSIIALYGANLLSRETVWDELVRRHVLDDDFDPETEAIRIESEMPTLQVQQTIDERTGLPVEPQP